MAGNRFSLVRRLTLRAAVSAATIVGAGGVVSVAWPGVASAAVPITAVGWWSQSPAAAQPTVPDGGISVANGPGGAVSVAAVRVDTGGGASSATLTLAEDSGQGQQAAALEACSTTNDWSPAKGDPMTAAPPQDCRNPVQLARDANGQWTGDIAPLLSGKTGPASVMVVPTPAAAGVSGGVPFQIAFRPPTVAGTTASSSDSTSSNSSSSETATSPSSSYSGTTSSDMSGSSSGTGSSGSAAFNSASTQYGSTGSPTPTAEVAATPAAQAAPTQIAGATSSPALSGEASASGGSGQFKANIADAGSSGRRATRGTALGVFGLALLIGAIAAAASWAKAQGMFEMAGLRERFSR